MIALQLAYAANIFILLPVAAGTLLKLFPTDQNCFEESKGWRVLVGSLWTAILVLSILCLVAPLRYCPLLLLQLIYKSLWLAVYAWPEIRKGNPGKVPWGIAISFLGIVLVWPWIIPWNYLFGLES